MHPDREGKLGRVGIPPMHGNGRYTRPCAVPSSSSGSGDAVAKLSAWSDLPAISSRSRLTMPDIVLPWRGRGLSNRDSACRPPLRSLPPSPRSLSLVQVSLPSANTIFCGSLQILGVSRSRIQTNSRSRRPDQGECSVQPPNGQPPCSVPSAPSLNGAGMHARPVVSH